jgi:hypothetical protein
MLDVLKAVRAHRRQQLLDPHTVQRGLDRSACRVESDGGAGLDLPTDARTCGEKGWVPW